MGKKSGIAWTDGTFNPWWGCVEVSPACDNCYARTWDARFDGNHWGKDAPRRFFGDKHWNEPLRWNRSATESGERFLVFCASMADVFESGRDDIEPHRARLWDLIRKTPKLTWLLLTKRPQNIGRMLPGDLKIATNIWPGTTVESPDYLWRAEALAAQTWARVRFVSMEPLLADTSIAAALASGINWVIAGGESGDGARPLVMDRVRKLRDESVAARVPFLFKQADEGSDGVTIEGDAFKKPDLRKSADGMSRRHWLVEKPFLDGKQWMQFPEVR